MTIDNSVVNFTFSLAKTEIYNFRFDASSSMAQTRGFNSDISLFKSVIDFSTSVDRFSSAFILTVRLCKAVELLFTVAKIIAMLSTNDFIDNSSSDVPRHLK